MDTDDETTTRKYNYLMLPKERVMRNSNNKIRVSKIYKRFILSFLIVLLLPVSCFALIFLWNYRELYREKVLKLAQNSLEASVMELERTTESLDSFVAYNLMADTISETFLLKDYSAKRMSNIISAQRVAQPILEDISYYNILTPDTIYVASGTYQLKYYASYYLNMDDEEYLLEQLNDSEIVGWTVWERVSDTKTGSEPALMYITRTWKHECWMFMISTKMLDKIINAEQSVTVLLNESGSIVYPFLPDGISGEMSGVPELIDDGRKYCEISVAASNGCFTLVRYMDEDYLFAEVYSWQNYFFTIIIAVLLAGGKSLRMGQCKALLKVEGETLLRRTVRVLTGFEELWLSTNDPALAKGLPVRLVADNYPGCGPLAGLEAALSATEQEALVCVSCDLPYLTESVPRLLLEMLGEADAAVCMDSAGRVHPLCGIYRRSTLPVIRRLLESGERRMMTFLRQIDCVYVRTEGLLPDEVFCNWNTPEDVKR